MTNEDASEKLQENTAIGFDMAAVSIQSRILPFWREQPRLWFAQFEALIEPLKTGDDQKYRYVLGALQAMDIQQISDILTNPPTTGKYTAVKNRLLSVYQASESRQFQKLLGGLELGDQKPSMLLRKMRDLGGKMVPEDALRVLWLNQLPAQMRAVLSVNTESALETLATMADVMMEHSEPPTINAVATTSQPSTSELQFALLSKQLEKLTLEIAELRRRDNDRNYPRPYNNRSRSQSRDRRNSTECYYHRRFGNAARKCQSPCSRQATSEN